VKNNIPLKYSNVLDQQFLIFVNKIISFRLDISSKLKEFWEAQIEIMDISEKKGIPYNPSKYAMNNKEQILSVNSIYTKSANRFAKNQSDEVLLYALFYSHILKIESIEYSFLSDFNETLKTFGLEKKYDAEEIFSVNGKVQRGWEYNKKTKKKVKKLWRTDGRAVRDCLGHNLFELDFSKNPWKIKFSSSKKGYEYNQIFNKNSFITFMNNTDLIYRCSIMLLFTIFVLTLCKQHLL